MMRRKLLVSLFLTALLLAFATPVFADDGKVLFGEDFVLKSGETYRGDVVIFDGKLILEEDSYLDGDAVVFGGSAEIAGKLGGDLAVFGGDVEVKSTGVVEGDVAVFGGEIHKEEGAVIEGQQTEMPLFGWGGKIPWGQLAYLRGWGGRPGFRYLDIFTGFAFGVLRFIVGTLALMAVSVLIIIFWPKQVEQVGETVLKVPLASGGVGLAALVLGIPVGLILVLAACLGLVVWLALFVAALFGFVAISLLIGERLLQALNVSEASPIVAVLIGVFLLRLLNLVPCLGFVFSLIVYSLALGAVILSRFGTQPYPPAQVAPAPALPPEQPQA